MKLAHLVLVLGGALPPAFAAADTPAHGTILVGSSAAGLHFLTRVDYDYDGAGHLTTASTLQRALGFNGYGSGYVLAGGYLILAGGGVSGRLQLGSGAMLTANPNSSGNFVTLAPGGATVWVGGRNAALASFAPTPFGDGVAHAVGGDDSGVTQLAFTPAHGVFYTTGGSAPSERGNVGTIDLGTFQTTRHVANIEATGMHYDPFSASLIVTAFGKAHQIDPAHPAALLSSRDDSATQNYLELLPDGAGHLLGLHLSDGGCGNPASALVLIDYSSAATLSDAATHIAAAALAVQGCATGLGPDADLFADGFEP